MLTKKSIGLLSLTFIVLAIGIWWFFIENAPSDIKFNLVKLERGDIENTVSCTGTISPLSEVEVGTQISGTIDNIYVDFNQPVKKGQLLAKLETELLESSLLSAQAGLEKAQATFEQAEFDYVRNKALFDSSYIAEGELKPYQIAYKTAKSSIKSARAELIRAKQNLEYAYIRSPISGTVIQKNVEQGQTVAASLATPTLFIIAENLSQIEIHAQVDESDIGVIKEGQDVRFEVPAYTDRVFTGKVHQIRLEPEVVSNVVNYTVVVFAKNADNLLLPGMTSTVDFIIESAKNELKIPNSALNFKPDRELARQVMLEKKRARQDSLKSRKNLKPEGFRPAFSVMPSSKNPSEDMGMVWFINDEGNIDVSPVKTGLSDGSYTALKFSGSLTEDVEVITGVLNASSEPTSSGSSTSEKRRFKGGFGGPRPF